jgi:hypothetical protein
LKQGELRAAISLLPALHYYWWAGGETITPNITNSMIAGIIAQLRLVNIRLTWQILRAAPDHPLVIGDAPV